MDPLKEPQGPPGPTWELLPTEMHIKWQGLNFIHKELALCSKSAERSHSGATWGRKAEALVADQIITTNQMVSWKVADPDSLVEAEDIFFIETPWLYQLQLCWKIFSNYFNVSSLLIKMMIVATR